MNVDKKGAQQLRVAMRTARGAVASQHIVLAKMFYEVRHSVIQVGDEVLPLWQYWKYDSWEDYVEHDTRFHYGWANAHIRMYEKVMIECKDFYRPEMVYSVGITNLLEISKVIQKSTANTWLRKASEMSCCELKHEVMKFNYAARGIQMKDARIFTRVMPGTVHKKLKKALLIGEELYGFEAPYKTLEKMADEFIARNKDKKPLRQVA